MPGSSLPSANRMVKVALIDDHPIVRVGLTALIVREPRFEICGEADDVASAMTLIRNTAPDVAIMEIALRRGSGIDLIRRIKAEKFPVKILVASMYDEGLFAERAVRAGASGYINKQEAGRNIVAALRDVISGKMYLSEKLSARILSQAVGGRGPSDQNPIATLSDRELDVFTLIGSGSTSAEIAAKLQVSVKTIDTYRQRIKDKLGLTTSAELSREAMHWALEQSK